MTLPGADTSMYFSIVLFLAMDGQHFCNVQLVCARPCVLVKVIIAPDQVSHKIQPRSHNVSYKVQPQSHIVFPWGTAKDIPEVKHDDENHSHNAKVM